MPAPATISNSIQPRQFEPPSSGWVAANVKAGIVASDKKSGAAADLRVYAGRTEPGAAWKARTSGKKPRDDLSVLLDDPSFVEPVRAALFEDDDGVAWLVWIRREA